MNSQNSQSDPFADQLEEQVNHSSRALSFAENLASQRDFISSHQPSDSNIARGLSLHLLPEVEISSGQTSPSSNELQE